MTERINSVLHLELVALRVSEVPASWPPRPALTIIRPGWLSSHVVTKNGFAMAFSNRNTNDFKQLKLPFVDGLGFLEEIIHHLFLENRDMIAINAHITISVAEYIETCPKDFAVQKAVLRKDIDFLVDDKRSG